MREGCESPARTVRYGPYTMKRIAILVGSLRKDSYNRKMANALVSLAPPSLQFEFVAFDNLPFYSEDREVNPPSEWVEFRKRVASFDGLLFVTPEYNRSIPGALKNALDVGSRPTGQGVWRKKPAAVMTVSPGPVGGFGANHHLRQTLVCLDVATMAQPEAYIGSAKDLFDENGALASERTRDFARRFIETFAAWVHALSPPPTH